MAIIKNWSVVGQGPFGFGRLAGEVYDHPRFYDGADVLTSFIVSAEGKNVTTRSGTYYQLETPCEEYLDSLFHRGLKYDPEQPVKQKSVEASSQQFEKDDEC